jgi:hypothetical protein
LEPAPATAGKLRLPLQKNKMLLLFPEQNETAATINQCVVFRINFGPHAYSI